MKILRQLGLALLVVFAAACATRPPGPSGAASAPVPLILVSIDGFRADYLDRGVTPVMSELAENGVRASMRPSFPSKTFPNHYTLVTGLRPDENGIVNNTMEDPRRPGVVFTLSDREQASDPFWWDDAVPIWVSAENAGLRTGTMFWPGSEFAIHGVRPSQWRTFDMGMSNEGRVDTLLSWLDLPMAERPVFFTLYFDTVDTAGHIYGPDAEETNAAVADVDAAIGRLRDGLAARGVDAFNIVIVSDHGMTAVSDDGVIDFDALAGPDLVHVVWNGETVGVNPLPGYEQAAEAALLGRHAHMECWRKEDLPAHLHYGTHVRVPAIVCLPDLGWRAGTAAMPVHMGGRGAHGFDPAFSDMDAIFVANGPGVKPGVLLERFDNIAVHPVLMGLLGLAAPPMAGPVGPALGEALVTP